VRHALTTGDGDSRDTVLQCFYPFTTSVSSTSFSLSPQRRLCPQRARARYVHMCAQSDTIHHFSASQFLSGSMGEQGSR
jgi:hypothetical protein